MEGKGYIIHLLYFIIRRGKCFSIIKPLLLLLKAIMSPGSVDNNVVINSIQILIMFQSKTIASSYMGAK